VHSYHLNAESRLNQISYCKYGYDFPASVSDGNIHGVQFHPEKSQKNGLQLLSNFCNF
jgi:glutamine amidotransferase